MYIRGKKKQTSATKAEVGKKACVAIVVIMWHLFRGSRTKKNGNTPLLKPAKTAPRQKKVVAIYVPHLLQGGTNIEEYGTR